MVTVWLYHATKFTNGWMNFFFFGVGRVEVFIRSCHHFLYAKIVFNLIRTELFYKYLSIIGQVKRAPTLGCSIEILHDIYIIHIYV